MSVKNKVKKVIAEQLKIDIDEVIPHANFVDDLGADSIDLVEIVMDVEDEFDLDIPDEDAEKLTTVQKTINYVEGHC